MGNVRRLIWVLEVAMCGCNCDLIVVDSDEVSLRRVEGNGFFFELPRLIRTLLDFGRAVRRRFLFNVRLVDLYMVSSKFCVIRFCS